MVAERHSWFPDGGYVAFTTTQAQLGRSLGSSLGSYLAFGLIGFYSRVLRENILDSLDQDYVRTALAKGLTPRRVMVKHALRASLIPVDHLIRA